MKYDYDSTTAPEQSCLRTVGTLIGYFLTGVAIGIGVIALLVIIIL